MEEKKIYITKDYNMFKELKGNRAVTDLRIDKIINSIREVGYITNPIIVNEKMEVIDGQGRLKALKYLKLPVEYIIVNGTGINECLYMNINQTNWNLSDYINSYAANGLESYIKLKKLKEKYPEYNYLIIITAAREVNKIGSEYIKSGNLIITDEEYEKAIAKLDWLKNFDNLFDLLKGKKQYLLQGLLYCYTFDCVNNDRLVNKMKELANTIEPFVNVDGAVEQIEKIYNKNIIKDYAFITTEYKRSLMTRLRAGVKAINEKQKGENNVNINS